MKKILGLDIGTNSIGWCLVIEAENENEQPSIIDTGVKVISTDASTVKNFEGGQATGANQERRKYRHARRNNFRYKLRREALVKKLIELEWFPKEWEDIRKRHEAFRLNSKHELYELRAKAAKGEKVALRDLGRILYHINQKRGYKSNRKVEDEENTSNSELLTRIEELEKELQTHNLTIGQFLFEKLQNNPRYRLKGLIFMRRSHQKEFDQIWNAQKVYYPDVLTDDLRKQLRDEIIFYQRHLKSQKRHLAECPFEKRYYKGPNGEIIEKGVKVAPRSSPVFQEYKIWQILANLRITNLYFTGTPPFDNKGERVLFDVEREAAFKYLMEHKKVNAEKLLKNVLKLNPEDGYSIENFDEIEGDDTREAILKAFKRAKSKPFPWIFEKIDCSKRTDDHLYYRLWHMLYSIDDPIALQNKLHKEFAISQELAVELTKVGFKNDYGSLSTRAMLRLIPHLRKGMTYDKAREAVYEETKNENWRSHKVTLDERLARILANQITPVEIGELRNPVVERITQHVINVVNEIISDQSLVTDEERQEGKFEIRIELARALKQNSKLRKKTMDMIKRNEKRREDAKNEIAKHLQIDPNNVPNSYIEKYLLWEEGNRICPYTFKPISLSDIFNGKCDVDHIIPQSRFFDDSMNNKVLCYATANQRKGNMTAYEYMTNRGKIDEFRQYVRSIPANAIKKKRLLAEEIPQDFINRQLKETQYITQVVRAKLGEVCHHVRTTTGSITAFLRKEWGLVNLIHELNFEKYKAVGLIKEIKNIETGEIKEVIENWSKRMDHRHHAVDALVVAFTKQAHINFLNSLNEKFGQIESSSMGGWRSYFKPPMEKFYAKAKKAIESILVKHQRKTKVVTPKIHRLKVKGNFSGKTQKVLVPRGPLHKESVYGKISINGKDEYVIRYPLDSRFKSDYVQYIIDYAVREKVRQRLAEHGNDPKKAFANLEDNPIYFDKQKNIIIRSVRCRTGLNAVVPIRQKSDGTPKDFVQTRNNHHIAIYKKEDGSLHHQIVTFWEAVERINQGVPLYQPEYENGTLIVALSINDMFVFDLDPDQIDFFDPKNRSTISKHLYRVQKISHAKNHVDIYFRHHTDSTTTGNAESQTIRNYIRITSLKNFSGTKVWLDQCGRIVKTSRKLP